MDTLEITRAIRQGELDAGLDAIEQAVHTRKKALKMERADELAEKLTSGDIVTITDVRPQYLEGAECVVVRVERSRGKAYVRLLDPLLIRRAHKYCGTSGVLQCRLSMLERQALAACGRCGEPIHLDDAMAEVPVGDSGASVVVHAGCVRDGEPVA
jgi:hypothetical protein